MRRQRAVVKGLRVRASTAAAYLADARLIAAAAAQFWAGDPAAVREVRRQLLRA